MTTSHLCKRMIITGAGEEIFSPGSLAIDQIWDNSQNRHLCDLLLTYHVFRRLPHCYAGTSLVSCLYLVKFVYQQVNSRQKFLSASLWIMSTLFWYLVPELHFCILGGLIMFEGDWKALKFLTFWPPLSVRLWAREEGEGYIIHQPPPIADMHHKHIQNYTHMRIHTHTDRDRDRHKNTDTETHSHRHTESQIYRRTGRHADTNTHWY